MGSGKDGKEMSSREIGSEFWEVPAVDRPTGAFAKSAQWFLSGRCALKTIIRELKDCRTVAMPSWCCDSMIQPFADAGFEVRFYPVFWQDGLIQEVKLDADVLLVMEYFGYSSCSLDLTGYRGVVIRDVTHSVFSAQYADADYYFGSLRKWCGVWTGGFAWADDGHRLEMQQGDDLGFVSLRREGMRLKDRYIRGEASADKGYLHVFNGAEEALEQAGIAPADPRDVELAMRLDVQTIRARRRANGAILQKAFPDWLMFPEMKAADCPLFVPVLVPQGRRDALRRYLIENEIYCPIHWPVSQYHRLDEKTGFIYENELSFVCDQRYSGEDMERTVAAVERFWKEA